jgi:branched-chain amino acid transport system ATP-binding protein
MLKTRNLTKRFGNLVAIDDVSIELGREPGELTFIVGPNGAGKTTFTNLLTGRHTPSEGEIYIDDADVTADSPKERLQAGLVRSFQLVHIFDEMTVRDNLRTVLFSREGKSRHLFTDQGSYDGIDDEIDELLDEFKIADAEDVVAKNLSHGDRKLLDVAMTFALDPKYLLLDEPTSGVGAGQTAELIETVVGASREHGIRTITIEHDMDIVTEYADRVVALHNGAILADGSADLLETDDELRSILLGLKND